MNNETLLFVIFGGLGLIGLFLLYGGVYIMLSKNNAERFLNSKISKMYFELEFFDKEKRYHYVRWFFGPLTIIISGGLLGAFVYALINLV